MLYPIDVTTPARSKSLSSWMDTASGRPDLSFMDYEDPSTGEVTTFSTSKHYSFCQMVGVFDTSVPLSFKMNTYFTRDPEEELMMG